MVLWHETFFWNEKLSYNLTMDLIGAKIISLFIVEKLHGVFDYCKAYNDTNTSSKGFIFCTHVCFYFPEKHQKCNILQDFS